MFETKRKENVELKSSSIILMHFQFEIDFILFIYCSAHMGFHFEGLLFQSQRRSKKNTACFLDSLQHLNLSSLLVIIKSGTRLQTAFNMFLFKSNSDNRFRNLKVFF